MAIGLKRTPRRWTERLRLASLDINAQHLSDFVTEYAGFRAAVRVSAGLNLFPSERDHQRNFYPVGGSVDVRNIERKVGHGNLEYERESVSRLDVIDHREISPVRFGRGVYLHSVWPVGNQPASVEGNPFAAVFFTV